MSSGRAFLYARGEEKLLVVRCMSVSQVEDYIVS